jgi:DNA replication protein DnaC
MKSTADLALLDRHLSYLCLSFVRQHCQSLATEAARKELSHLDYLAQLAEGEASLRQDRAVARRIKAARFPLIKTLDSFRWDWPKKINRLQIQDLFGLQFVEDKANVIFLGLVGVGKSHLATALGYAACLRGKSVLFANAIDVINTLSAAQNKGALKAELRKYLAPSVLLLDEVGYLPIDQRGADLLFQVISQRYERGSIVLTTNKAFKQWPSIFNGDSTITSAVLDRLLHHAEIVLIEGTSFRMKDRVETSKLLIALPFLFTLYDIDFQTGRSSRFSRRRSHPGDRSGDPGRVWHWFTELLDGWRAARHDLYRQRPARLPDDHEQGGSQLRDEPPARAVRRARHGGSHLAAPRRHSYTERGEDPVVSSLGAARSYSQLRSAHQRPR